MGNGKQGSCLPLYRNFVNTLPYMLNVQGYATSTVYREMSVVASACMDCVPSASSGWAIWGGAAGFQQCGVVLENRRNCKTSLSGIYFNDFLSDVMGESRTY